MQHGRGRRAPTVARLTSRDTFRPLKFAFKIESENAQITEIEINSFAIRNGRFRGIAVFQMDRRFGRGLMNRLLPQKVPGFEIDAVGYPTVNRCGRVGPIPTKIKAFLRLLRFAGIDYGTKKYFASPHDRGRPTAARDVRFPSDVFGGRPFFRKRITRPYPSSARASKLGPIGCFGRQRCENRENNKGKEREAEFHEVKDYYHANPDKVNPPSNSPNH